MAVTCHHPCNRFGYDVRLFYLPATKDLGPAHPDQVGRNLGEPGTAQVDPGFVGAVADQKGLKNSLHKAIDATAAAVAFLFPLLRKRRRFWRLAATWAGCHPGLAQCCATEALTG